MNKNYSRY